MPPYEFACNVTMQSAQVLLTVLGYIKPNPAQRFSPTLSPSTTTPPTHHAALEIFYPAQRPDNLDALIPAVFESATHRESVNQITDAQRSC